MFLNTTATVANWNAEGTECSLVTSGAHMPRVPPSLFSFGAFATPLLLPAIAGPESHARSTQAVG